MNNPTPNTKHPSETSTYLGPFRGTKDQFGIKQENHPKCRATTGRESFSPRLPLGAITPYKGAMVSTKPPWYRQAISNVGGNPYLVGKWAWHRSRTWLVSNCLRIAYIWQPHARELSTISR